MTRYLMILCLAFLSACRSAANAPQDDPQVPDDPGLYEKVSSTHSLFDGNTLEGWHDTGEGSFEVVDGLLQSTGKDGYLWHGMELDEYTLSLEFKAVKPGSFGHLYLGLEDPAEDPVRAVERTYHMVLKDGDHASRIIPGSSQAGGVDFGLPGEWRSFGGWNRIEVDCRKRGHTVFLHGRMIDWFPGPPSPRSQIGLHGHTTGRVAFRNVRVTVLREGGGRSSAAWMGS